MGLILPQQIEIKWHPNTREHYTSLGYKFTSYNDYFYVHVSDLTKGSSYNVKIQCDYCGEISEIPWKSFLKLSGNTYCCQECLKHKRIELDDNGNVYYV